MFRVYHAAVEKGTRVYIVPNHYNHSLKYIKETLEKAKNWGLTIPDDGEITFEVLKGDTHSGMLSVEFTSKTPLIKNDEYVSIDLDLYPHMGSKLVY